MNDVLGSLIAEGRNANLASGRVRGFEPAPASKDYAGDARAAGSFQRFVVLSILGTQRIPRVPVAQWRIGFRAYGVTPQDATALYGELSDVYHLPGARIGTSGVQIHQSVEDIGGEQGKDPDTSQPYVAGVIELLAATG